MPGRTLRKLAVVVFVILVGGTIGVTLLVRGSDDGPASSVGPHGGEVTALGSQFESRLAPLEETKISIRRARSQVV